MIPFHVLIWVFVYYVFRSIKNQGYTKLKFILTIKVQFVKSVKIYLHQNEVFLSHGIGLHQLLIQIR